MRAAWRSTVLPCDIVMVFGWMSISPSAAGTSGQVVRYFGSWPFG